MGIRSGALLALLLGAGNSLVADVLYSVTDLGSLGGGISSGSGINNAGQVTGSSWPLSSSSHAFLYSNGQMSDLGTLGGSFSVGEAINDAGQVAGFSDTFTNATRAFLYSNDQMTDLGTSGGTSSYGNGINNAGQVTGFSGGSLTAHTLLYSNGQVVDLGPGIGYAINDAGQVTGASNGHAFLYSNGRITDLNDLIDPALGIPLTGAAGINNHGQIVAGYGSRGGSYVYLLTPVPEPSTCALLSIPLSVLLVWSRPFQLDAETRSPSKLQ
ncbi:MAG TPA: HAF repeat/PEP-CTERM domain-containing protein [Verrucomicrobiae bacterium]|nr:HAF repeat/PEP-CTERM domain-containing protein [Verrucomicrobiae bacterium]